MSDEQDNFTVGGFSEWQRGEQQREPDEVLPHSGYVRDDQIDRQMSVRAIHHDTDRWDGDAPANYLGVQKNKDILSVEGGQTARQALETGDTVTLKHFIGDPDQQHDLANLQAIHRLEKIVNGPAPVIVVLGKMGAGKSDFAGLIGEVRNHLVDGHMKVASNIQTLRRNDDWVREDGAVHDGWVTNFPLLSEWVEQDGEPVRVEDGEVVRREQSPKLFVGDEFSSAGSGSGEQAHLVRKLMGPLVFKIRKYNGALIYIGHDESSIHPMLWRVGTIIKKVDKKTALIADRISNGNLQDVEKLPLNGIPKTNWNMATEEASDWSWTAPSTEDEAGDPLNDDDAKKAFMWTLKACRDEGMSPNQASQFVPFSHTTVYDWYDDYDEGGEKRNWVETVDQVIA
ncbi:hypothetical protein GS429_04310 [Natronorubrum sp. JWXQ-INN-674]|uniref:Uncharacterized protein n=1 Tax=Natronorubrum halalkaliphilum TaxID=2691917 RepID=A0A6B0VL51_9EURY|nr:hypothetical protein [Natronorubrum halalkaliphilum]MXV61299.1 hypothetical protein [Natronorubrum halalkaliphilum]